MKIRRFIAPDMRQAIRQVRDSLGSDAVILSNKTVAGGVELVAAKDFDATALASPMTSTLQSGTDMSATYPEQGEGPGETAKTKARKNQASNGSKPAAPARIEWSQDPVLVEMRGEMRALRRLMENELSELTWRDLGRRQPEMRELLRRLIDLDLNPDLCRKIADRAQGVTDPDQAWQKSMDGLEDELPVVETNLLEYGGVAAVIGPTGVGKTTTVAKLAARYCLRQGKRHLALITTDNFRIGAQEQLQDYARILDVPVRTAASADEFNAALNAFSDKRLVLIDTAGVSQQDVRLGEQLALLSSGHQSVHCFLTLSATTHQSSLALAVKSFGAAKPDAAILTKVDESASLGGVFSALIQARLPLAFVTDGQKVPEDLHIARARSLVNYAVTMKKQEEFQYTEDYLAIALGGASGHAHA